MSEGKVRWGVLSTANIGRKAVIPAIHAAANGEVVAVASRDAQKAADFAGETGIPHSYGSYEELLTAPAIDAVYIPLPNSMHKEWTIKAAQAGKHILCEKPLALDAADCAEMQAAADAAGVLLMEAFMYRFHPRTERVLELLRGGALGPLRTVQSAFTFRSGNPDDIRLQADLGGGALMDVGCYCVNIARTAAGQEPVEAQAYARWHANGVDEQLAGVLFFPDGVVAQFDCALTQERREFYALAGDKGYIEAAKSFVAGNGDVEIVQQLGAAHTREVIAGADQYTRMVEHFGACVLEGEALRYDAAEAAANMRAIEALYRSARNGGRPEVVR